MRDLAAKALTVSLDAEQKRLSVLANPLSCFFVVRQCTGSPGGKGSGEEANTQQHTDAFGKVKKQLRGERRRARQRRRRKTYGRVATPEPRTHTERCICSTPTPTSSPLAPTLRYGQGGEERRHRHQGGWVDGREGGGEERTEGTVESEKQKGRRRKRR